MEIGYKYSPKEIKKLSKFTNPSIILEKENIVKNGKYKIHLTKNMFNKLLSENKLKYFLLIRGNNIIQIKSEMD